ncbi:MAG: hypothetical protein IOC87_04005 [Rhodobacter sp.]|nr:hypothetical protein [Rhodobacter sp.]
MGEPPAVIQWAIRRLHQGLNRWTQRRLAGQADRRFGWSAWSYAAAAAGSRIGAIQVWIIDAIFWRGHCEQDYRRILAGAPLDTSDWRLVWAVARLLLLLLAPLAVLAWWVW